MKIIFFVLISTLYFSCGVKCPPSSVEPKDIQFMFSVVDKHDKDLFFGKDSIYNPYTVKIEGYQRALDVLEKEKCFSLSGFYPKKESYLFYSN